MQAAHDGRTTQEPFTMIFVTGASGHLGQLVIDHLLQRVPAAQIVAGVRSLEKGAAFAARGVEVRVADYDRPETLGAALKGVEKLLLVSASEIGKRGPQHAAVIRAARDAGVSFVAYTSILHADRNPVSLAKEHQATEAALRESGIPHALLRNGWYIENYTGNLAGALASGAMIGSAGDGRIAAAARADFAEAAAVVLTTPGHAGRAYELAGDTSFTMAELAATVSQASGKPVAYHDMPQADYAAALQQYGLPAPVAEMLADSDAGIRQGALDDRSGTLSRLIGRPTTPYGNVVIATVKG
jgi:NAD(P)H dehydrogenase (quinone)